MFFSTQCPLCLLLCFYPQLPDHLHSFQVSCVFTSRRVCVYHVVRQPNSEGQWSSCDLRQGKCSERGPSRHGTRWSLLSPSGAPLRHLSPVPFMCALCTPLVKVWVLCCMCPHVQLPPGAGSPIRKGHLCSSPDLLQFPLGHYRHVWGKRLEESWLNLQRPQCPIARSTRGSCSFSTVDIHMLGLHFLPW